MDAKQAWQVVVGQLQMDMSKATFDTWLRDADYLDYQEDTVIIGLHNAYARDWLDTRLSTTVTRSLSGIMNKETAVKFIISQNNSSSDLSQPTATITNNSNGYTNGHSNGLVSTVQQPVRNPTIAPKYTFEDFVVGNNNRLAHAASVAVSENPAKAYNPLFIYGGVGLGKTHLLHAIGNTCSLQGLNVLYVSSEDFTNDMINAIRTHTTQEFREKYRQCDVLLIDDIQFIAGKESTQEEFFHTFNALHGQDKQLVMTSDRPPKAMNTLEERLRSRFEWGLTADIQPPDLETRIAILRFKADRSGREVPADVLEIIARRLQSNIRELEGALTRVLAYSDLRGLPLTPEIVKSAIGDLLPRQQEIDPQNLIRIVSDHFGISVDRLLGRERSNQVALPRQISMYLLREEANISLPSIGQILGGRDHSTVMYACSKIRDLMESDNRLRSRVFEIRQELYNRNRPMAI